MKKLLLAFVATAALCGAPAAPAADTFLPPFEVLDAGSQPVSSAELSAAGNWLIAVIDGGLPSARRFLDALGSKNERFGDNVVILVLGTAEQFDQLRQVYGTLGDVRWVRSDRPALLGELGLTGVPARIALHAGGRIASRRAGLGRSPDELARQVRTWTGSTAPDGQ